MKTSLLEETSEEFRARFRDADLIVAKVQGNFETLCGLDRNIFFLLTVKCAAIGAEIGAPVGALALVPASQALAGEAGRAAPRVVCQKGTVGTDGHRRGFAAAVSQAQYVAPRQPSADRPA